MLLLYPSHCNLNPRFAALVTLHIEKFISLFLPSVHFWNRNFLSRWEREESWVLVPDLNAASVPTAGCNPGLQLDLGSHLVILAWLPSGSLQPSGIVKSEANTPPFSLCRVSFQPVYLFLSCMTQAPGMGTVVSADDQNHVSQPDIPCS